VQDANARFVEMANPHAWLLTANDLHEQALHLYGQRGRSMTTWNDYRDRTSRTWDNIDKSVFLLGGFALENAIKAFLVYENPNWISNGSLSKKLRSHSLTGLQSQSAQIPLKTRYTWVLSGFEEGLDSWARYPCSLSVETSVNQRTMTSHLWSGYIRLMRAYGIKLQRLLSRQWQGPHGFSGRWTFTGEFLSV
jgi:hypothetical protein